MAAIITNNAYAELTTAAAADSRAPPVNDWQIADVLNWAKNMGCSDGVCACLEMEQIDGQVLLALNDEDIRDFRYRLNYKLTFGELKKLALSVRVIQRQYAASNNGRMSGASLPRQPSPQHAREKHTCRLGGVYSYSLEHICNPFGHCSSCDTGSRSRIGDIPPEFAKTVISMCYSFVVTGLTSFVMVIVHERVPDMKRYPPLPDIFLDNVPHIPWAFAMSEYTGTLLFSMWAIVCVFHKHRLVLMRRFFALAGTVFLLRCITMLITSLSVPGTHLQCNQMEETDGDDRDAVTMSTFKSRIYRALRIWSGLGMSMRGVRTCGDYMFSGHTVALTLLNFCITEYTPRHLYFLHTLTWLLNMFGIFFILAAHEHYSIDIFVAFYITSRLFLYYHTLANNQALMSRDSKRTRIWFPLFSYFESSVHGIVPNEYDSLSTLLMHIWGGVLLLKDTIVLHIRHVWFESYNTSGRFVKDEHESTLQRNATTSTTSAPSTETSTSSLERADPDLVQSKPHSQYLDTEALAPTVSQCR